MDAGPFEDLEDLLISVTAPKEGVADEARHRWDAVAKPLGSLGVLEDDIVRIAAAHGTPVIDISRRALAVFAADNGVVAEGVTQCGQEVTALGVSNLCRGVASASRMAEVARCAVSVMDVGVARSLTRREAPGLIRKKVRRGTGDIATGPACTRTEAEAAVLAGADLARELAWQGGFCLLAAGEMGIGNTTTAAAVACALTGMSPDEAVGRGSGLTDEGLERKRAAVARALEVNRPDAGDPVGVLARVGGLDIAAMCGFYLGAAATCIPSVLDGAISVVAALAACRLAPACREYLLASHASAEPVAAPILRELGLSPAIDAGLRLGEGTGALALMPLLDMAAAVYSGAATFTDTGMDAYEHLG